MKTEGMAAIRLLLPLVLLILGPASAPAQQPPVEFRVAESDPGFTGRIGLRTTLFVRLSYKSDRPVRFQAEGRAAGQKVAAAASYNVAPPYPAGEGEALVWIAFGQPATINELRIKSFDERWQPLTTIDVPVQLEWSGSAQIRRRPEWAERLNRAQQESVRVQAQKADEGYEWIGGLIIGLGGVSILGYLVLQAFLPWQFSGGWRIATLIPLLATIPLFGHAIYALNAGSNLWPIGLIFLIPVAFLYMVILLVVHSIRARPRAGDPAAPSGA